MAKHGAHVQIMIFIPHKTQVMHITEVQVPKDWRAAARQGKNIKTVVRIREETLKSGIPKPREQDFGAHATRRKEDQRNRLSQLRSCGGTKTRTEMQRSTWPALLAPYRHFSKSGCSTKSSTCWRSTLPDESLCSLVQSSSSYLQILNHLMGLATNTH